MSKHRVNPRMSIAEASALIALAEPGLALLRERESQDGIVAPEQQRQDRAGKRAVIALRVALANTVNAQAARGGTASRQGNKST
jgi:hypothetical protein